MSKDTATPTTPANMAGKRQTKKVSVSKLLQINHWNLLLIAMLMIIRNNSNHIEKIYEDQYCNKKV